MSASTPKSTAQNAPAESPTHVTLPAPAVRPRRPSDLPNPLLQTLGQLLAIALCLSLPGAAGLILIMLMIYNIRDGGTLLWIWIPMIVFVEAIAIFCALGIWRELTGWSRPRDYLR